MAKKSRQTGTQKKATKQLAHETRKGGKYREQEGPIFEKYVPGERKYSSTESKLLNTLNRYSPYMSSSKRPYKEIEPFLRGGKAYEDIQPSQFDKLHATRLGDIGDRYGRAFDYAQKGMDPIIQAAYQDFNTQTVPGIYGQFGRESGASSSPLNQALAQANQDLKLKLSAQLAPIQSQIAQGLLGQNLGERERARFGNLESQQLAERINLQEQMRQQNMQYGAATDLYGQKKAANLGYSQDKRNIVEYMNRLGLGAAQQLGGIGLQGMQGGFNPPYLQQGNQGGSPSFGSRIGSSVLAGIGGGIGGFLAGGPPGAAIGSVSGGIQGLGYGGAQPGFMG